MMKTALQKVIDIFDLESVSEDTFNAQSLYIPTSRTYGGQFLAQSLAAAALTTSEYRLPSSIHAIFMKGGFLNQDLTYEVERLRDGAKYSHREVSAFQNAQGEKPLFKAMITFHEEEEAYADFSAQKAPKVPSPDDLPPMEDLFSKYDGKNAWMTFFCNEMAFDIRSVSPSLFFGSDPDGLNAKEIVWVKIRDEDIVSLTPLQNRMLLAYVSDQYGFSPVLRKSGLNWTMKDTQFVSLDHTQYFHRDIDMNEWHLFVGDSPAAANARGIGVVNVFNTNGDIVSTYIQEGSIRAPRA